MIHLSLTVTACGSALSVRVGNPPTVVHVNGALGALIGATPTSSPPKPAA